MQSKALLGKRYSCFKCGCKFYDLNRPEPTCPKCGTDQREDPTPDPRVAVMARYKASRVTPPPTAEDTTLDEPNEDEDIEFDEFEDEDDDDPGFDEEEEAEEED